MLSFHHEQHAGDYFKVCMNWVSRFAYNSDTYTCNLIMRLKTLGVSWTWTVNVKLTWTVNTWPSWDTHCHSLLHYNERLIILWFKHALHGVGV